MKTTRLRSTWAVSLLVAACASGRSECHANTWSGTCRLVRVEKIRENEFPLPNVVLAAVYRPQPAAGQTLLPPDAQREFTALSKYEDALRAHLEAHPSASCYVNPPAPGQCQPGPLNIDVPEFDPTRAQASAVEAGPTGCAQIEATSAQDRITQSKGGLQVIEERFEFAENSAELPEGASPTLDGIASRLKQAPSLQCVAVVGAWVRGESVAVAFARARAVREQLIQRGVGSDRLIALTVDPNMVSTTGVPEPPNAKDRKVTLRVLLELPAAGSGGAPSPVTQ